MIGADDILGGAASRSSELDEVGAAPPPEADPPPGIADRGSPPVNPGRRGPSTVLFVALGILVVLAAGFALVAVRHHDQKSQVVRASGIPSSIPTPLATLMSLAPLPAKPAPDFTLVDQNGQTLSLSDFRGRVVVLEFMDPHCTDICPIVSQEVVDAYHDLGPAATRAVFVTVNVNPYHPAVSDVAAFTNEHRLNTVPNWHFVTGSVSALQSVWSSYGIAVEAPSPDADIIHSSFLFFIDPSGKERYLADSTVDHSASGASFLPAGQLTSWGTGIALVSRSLLG